MCSGDHKNWARVELGRTEKRLIWKGFWWNGERSKGMEWPARCGRTSQKWIQGQRQLDNQAMEHALRNNRHVFIDSINLLQKYVVERGPQVLLLLLAIYRAELASIDFLTNISSN